MSKVAAVIVTVLVVLGVTECLGSKMGSPYSNLPVTAHDLYRVSVVKPDGVVFTVVAVDVPFSFHTSTPGWYVVPVELNVKGIFERFSIP